MSYTEKNETKSMPKTFGWRKAAPRAPAYKLRRKDPGVDREKWLWLGVSSGVAAAPHIKHRQSMLVFQYVVQVFARFVQIAAKNVHRSLGSVQWETSITGEDGGAKTKT